MLLKEFIKEALLQITKGVMEAQSELESEEKDKKQRQKALISPYISESNEARGHGIDPFQVVDFDVAVTAESGTKAGGGISVLSLGVKGEVIDSTVTASRVKFKVPVRLPSIQIEY